MTFYRLVMCALAFYNVGNDDWRAVITCFAIWAGVELGMVWTRHHDRREAETAARKRAGAHWLNGDDRHRG